MPERTERRVNGMKMCNPSSYVIITGSTISGNVYGGGNQANITKGNTQVLVLGGTAVLGYLPVLLGVSLITGTLTGFVASLLFRAMRGIYFTQ